MTGEEMNDQAGDRGLVQIRKGSNGARTWAVSARVGDSPEQLLRAYEAARVIEQKLREGDEQSVGKAKS